MNIIDVINSHYNVFILGVAALGFIIGSFLNVVIYRLPIILENEYEKDCIEYFKDKLTDKLKTFNLITPDSHCPNCQSTVLWWQNIPVISYIILQGKCKNCQATISWRYPIVELLTAILTVLVVIHFGITVKTLPMLLLTWMLIPAVFIDFDKQLLPDNITIPLIWFGLLVNITNTFTTPTQAIVGAVYGYIFLWAITKTFKLIRKVDGMGYGDFKLLAAFGAWLGWKMLPVIILTSSLAGAIVGLFLILIKKHKFSKRMPFGPFLATTGWLAFFWQNQILGWLSANHFF